jgi:hypothetical protein
MHSKRIIEREFRAQTMDGNAETQQTYAEVTMIPSGTRTGRCKSSVIHRMIDRAPLPFLRLWVCHSGIIWQISSPPPLMSGKSQNGNRGLTEIGPVSGVRTHQMMILNIHHWRDKAKTKAGFM